MRELRVLLAAQMRRPPGEIDWPMVRQMLFDVAMVRESGCNPIIELRLRRYRRRTGLRLV